MRYINFIFVILLVTLTEPLYADIAKNINLKVGDTKLISLEGVTDIVVGNEDILKVELLEPNDLVLKGLKSGFTELLIRYHSGTNEKVSIAIAALKDQKEQLQIKWLRQKYSELDFEDNAGAMVVTGQLNKIELADFNQAVKAFPHWLVQVDELPAAVDQMIELQVTILEVKRQSAQHLGIKWPNAISGPTLSDSGAQWVTFPITILAQPKLMAASGGQADFLVGGEFPIPQVVAQGGQDVEFRDYGISLSMSPHDLGEGQISTEIKAQISTIDPATAIQGIPGMLTRRVSSLITAKSGEAIILSGLFNQEQSLQAESFPYLHNLPIIGQLFSSREFRDAETELMVVVTPMLQSHHRQTNQEHKHSQALIQLFRDESTCVGLNDDI
ncbi:MAG: hypothetical protein B7X54_04770 [Idiomarina sp. 34-48-12]|nr:MAG: hypothetical protein B7X54_04770 [Idiomarina sp. 34-48-12]